MSASAQPLNETKLHEFMMKAVGEMGAAMNAALILVGDKLGIYKAMAGAGPMTSEEIAVKTKTHERYVREWLAAQSAGGSSPMTLQQKNIHCRPSRRSPWLTRTALFFFRAFSRLSPLV